MGFYVPKSIFTSRELEIMDLVWQALSNKSIADILYLSTQTIKNHLFNIKQKIKKIRYTKGYNSRMLIAKVYEQIKNGSDDNVGK